MTRLRLTRRPVGRDEGILVRPAVNPRFFRTPILFRALFVLLLVQTGLPAIAAGQTVRGHLFDSETRGPVVNGTVALRDSLGAVVARTASGEDGAFSVTAPHPGRFSLLVVGLGYRSAPSGDFVVEPGGEVTVDVFLSPKPIEIQGFDVGTGSFQERLSKVKTGLDLRLARLPGESKVVVADRVRVYDTIQAKDPYRLLWRELRLGWSFNQETLRAPRGFGREVSPEVYVDDHRTWLLNLVLMPNSSICRVERYEPPPFMPGPKVPFQLRAYTCQFMAEVATGRRQMRETINWGDLIAGPGGGDDPSGTS